MCGVYVCACVHTYVHEREREKAQLSFLLESISPGLSTSSLNPTKSLFLIGFMLFFIFAVLGMEPGAHTC